MLRIRLASAVALAAAVDIVVPGACGAAAPLAFLNQTATRMTSDPLLGVSDPEEKDYGC